MRFDHNKSSKLGTALTAEEKAYVLNAFNYRFTGDHKPAWAHVKRSDGTAYPVQFSDDADWLAHTRFQVKPNGRLDKRADCYSMPTWPDGNPFTKA